MKKALPDVSYLRQRLDYDPATGIFIWRARPAEQFPDAAHGHTWNTRYAGKSAGSMNNSGYLKIGIDDEQFLAHRIAWLMFHGSSVPHDIDHVDGNRTNNRIANLRAATRAENLANMRRLKTNTGIKGVYFDAKRQKFQAHITVSYRQHNLGRFDTLEEAITARREAAMRLHGSFARHE